MRRVARFGLLAVVGAITAVASAQTSKAGDDAAILKRVDEHYNHLASLRTRFTETYAGLGMNRSETGTLLLKKPGRMRWEYSTPAGKVFVLDGRFAWSYTPGDPQVERAPAKQMDDLRSPLRFLLGHTQLKKELNNVRITPTSDGFEVAGLPRGMEQRVKQLVLKTARDGRIISIRLDELDGAVTEFRFEGSEENVAIPESEFHYTPPAGVAVVDGLPPI